MGVKVWIVEKYVGTGGQVPFDRWFDSLDEDVQARVDARIDRLSLGNFGDFKSLGGGVHELRFFIGPGYRVYFGKVDNRIVLLLCGGDKRSQRKDIKLAQGLWRQYLSERKR